MPKTFLCNSVEVAYGFYKLGLVGTAFINPLSTSFPASEYLIFHIEPLPINNSTVLLHSITTAHFIKAYLNCLKLYEKVSIK